MIYDCVLEVEVTISVSQVLKELGVSTSGYYAYKKRHSSQQELRKKKVIEEIKEIHEASYQIYGAPKTTHKLRQQGIVISQKTVSNYMRESGIKAHYRKPYTITTISRNVEKELKDCLQRQFRPSRPNAVWCTDITYIWTQTGFVYLTSIIDLYSRKIIAWELTEDLSVDGIISCLNQAKRHRNHVVPTVIHSDRGTQYLSNAYTQHLGQNMTASYCRKGNPWDNACIESFHSLIKREWLNRLTFNTIHDARRAVFEYINVFYNRFRIHSTLGYMTPQDFEFQYVHQH